MVGVDALVAAALLQRINVRVGDEDAVLFVQRDDLVQPLRRRIADDRQRRARNATGEADELQMRQHLAGEHVVHLAHALL